MLKQTMKRAGQFEERLPFRKPFEPSNVFGHLAATAVSGVEEWRDGWYRRTLHLRHGIGIVALAPRDDFVACRLRLEDQRDLNTAIRRCRWLLDLDADPESIDQQLSTDHRLRVLVKTAPGRRVPRTVDAHEFAVRAVLGQQVSTAAARTHASRLVAAYGTPVEDVDGGLTRLFPTSEQLLDLNPDELALPMKRRETLLGLIRALANGDIELDLGGPWEVARQDLNALPGFGPWTIETIAMRALGDPDAFLVNDLGVVNAAKKLGMPSDKHGLSEESQLWRPWRAYAVQHLWATSDHAVNQMPSASDDK